MDLEDWELLLPPDAYDLPPAVSTIPRLDLDMLIDMNYFVSPSPVNPFLSQIQHRLQISELPELSPGDATDMAECVKSPPDKIFFEKKKEAEFVDMKVESSPSTTSATTSEFRRAIPHLDLLAFTFQEKNDVICCNGGEGEEEKEELKGKKGNNSWRWGMETLFSMGVAATVMYVMVVIGKGTIQGKKRKEEMEPLKNHKVRFKMYADEEHHQVCLRMYV